MNNENKKSDEKEADDCPTNALNMNEYRTTERTKSLF